MNEIASTILQQLGANRFVAMTGAKDFVHGDRMLQFSVGTNALKVTKVRVTLTPDDLYRVDFYAGRGLRIREVASRDFVFAGDLRRVFEAHTGLRTSL